ncbi:flagellar basal-body rod protein FlgC [Pseudomonas nitritireducens]|uniref:Flagellar basal-body rod protein FlgC n=1 Tax=Pseudomonas nitroreducens TaxID=46680 RepID=A0A7W7KN58_PSENT|nr:flagellar basal body rod protein FlgC [Pseudomonas nitritireducens]MBB4865363.1 flagellar basal-body rod protein FlgC [Pseudomonas nitritireducens]
MPMFSIFDISGSALSAQSIRMNAAASNMANADSVSGPNGEAYRAKQVMFEAQGRGEGLGGVQATKLVEDTAPLHREYKPGHPLADKDGYIETSNVNPVNEMVNMMAASRSYQANLEIMGTAKQLMQKTLTMGEN